MTSRDESTYLEWIAEEQLKEIISSSYWNDENEEKVKEFDIRDGDTGKLRHYLEKETSFTRQFNLLMDMARSHGRPLSGRGVDLGAGAGWTSALLSRIPAVRQVHAVDLSRHRIGVIAPLVFRMLKAEEGKIIRVLGSFYDVQLPDGSLDFCFFSQAFHHADNPRRLLREVHRLLRPSGVVLVMGEIPIGHLGMLRQWGLNVIKRVAPFLPFRRSPVRKWFPGFSELFPPDELLGDHFYRMKDYRKLFQQEGFSLVHRRCSGGAIFLATPLTGVGK